MALILSHNYETGDTIATLGYSAIGFSPFFLSNQSGEGLGGSTWGVRGNSGASAADKYYSRMRIPVSHSGRDYNVIADFDHVDHIDAENGEYAIQLVDTTGGVMFSLGHGYSGEIWQDGADNGVTMYFAGATIPDWVSAANVLTPGTAQRISVCGQLSSGVGVADGSVSLYVDGALIVAHTGIHLYSVNTTLGFVYLNPMGRFDNFSVYDNACFALPTDPNIPGTCCGSAGPGGTDPGRAPDDRTTTPRVIPPLGALPSYTACVGGGIPSTASDPTDPQDLIGAITPLVHVQLSLPDSTVLRYSDHDVNYTSGNGSSVTRRVLSWGPVPKTLADLAGSFDPMRTSVRLSDVDGVIRGHLSSTTNRYLDGREATIFIESKANAALSVNPRVLARGVITNWKTTNNLDVVLDIIDPLGYRYSSVSLDRPIPHRTFRLEMFPDCPEHILGQPVPIIYGEYSDDYTWSINPARIPIGITPVYFVGRANSIPGLIGMPEDHWHAFVVCGHAIAGIQSWFASNVDPAGPGSVRMDPGTAGVDFLIPGYSGWSARVPTDYVDITGSDGIVERFTMIFARGPRGDAAALGEVPITLNICGLEDVGDGSGEVITDMAYQMQHFVQHVVLQNYYTGNWGAVPTFPGGTPKVSTSSFAAVKAVRDAYVGGGYQGAAYIATQQPARQHLAELQIGMDIRLGVNHHGQILGKAFDFNASTTGLTSFTAAAHLEESQFDVDPRLDEIINVRSAQYGFEAGTGFVAGPKITVRDTASIARHSERTAGSVLMIPTRQSFVAVDLIQRKLVRGAESVASVRCKVDLRGMNLNIGQLIELTDFRGVGSTGWTNHVVMVTKVITRPNAGEMLCEIEAEDVHDLLSVTMMALDVGTLDMATIG